MYNGIGCFSVDNDYASIVRFASSLVDALLFVHYLAVILVELRHLQSQYAVKVIRSPDGASRTYTVGEYSVQQLAAWCLDRYYRDFETYNPYLETVAQRGPRRMTEFKVCAKSFM
jgi:vang-like